MTELELHQLVELQGEYAEVYPLSPSGARGWVRGIRQVPCEEMEVFIEWDKDHWRYQGEIDGWTFAHHFRVVDDSDVTENHPDLKNALHAEPQLEAALPMRHKNVELPEGPKGEEFINTLMSAEEALLASDGYLIISVAPRRDEQATIFEPELHSAFLTPSAKEMLKAQLVHLAMQFMQDDVSARLERLEREYDEE